MGHQILWVTKHMGAEKSRPQARVQGGRQAQRQAQGQRQGQEQGQVVVQILRVQGLGRAHALRKPSNAL